MIGNHLLTLSQYFHFFAATSSTMKGLTHGKMGLEGVTTVIHSFVNGEGEEKAAAKDE